MKGSGCFFPLGEFIHSFLLMFHEVKQVVPVTLNLCSQMVNSFSRSWEVTRQAMLWHWGRWCSFRGCAKLHRFWLKWSSATWSHGGKVHLRPGMGTAELSWDEVESGKLRWRNGSWLHRWPDWSCYVWGRFNFHRCWRWRRDSGHVCMVLLVNVVWIISKWDEWIGMTVSVFWGARGYKKIKNKNQYSIQFPQSQFSQFLFSHKAHSKCNIKYSVIRFHFNYPIILVPFPADTLQSNKSTKKCNKVSFKVHKRYQLTINHKVSIIPQHKQFRIKWYIFRW